MTTVVDLTPERIRVLKAVFGSLHSAAVAALQDPLFAEEFAATGARLVTLKDGSLTFLPPAERYEALFWNLVWETYAAGKPHDKKPASTEPELKKGIADWDLLFNHERRWPNEWPVSRKEAQLVVELREKGVPGERGDLNRGIKAVRKATKASFNGELSFHKVRFVYAKFPLERA